MTSSRTPQISSKEQAKLLSRGEELTKQESSLKREYTTMLRKLASVTAVLQELEDDPRVAERVISEAALLKVPDLKPYSRLLDELDNKAPEDIEIPDFLQESYALYKSAPLLYKDL
ncbi:LAME_0F10770g1_1 [Lachancea meyersii CBS 8951]|uniref:LAME_0F10770g1_1 n=1 Tax=Lachancea meyersii CBS 8951 TaxID=1266667 RepID=A0A1G4JVW0_9SACH|nr:LAME_0F10770g1_1 [Lachancea meyersii CBS 8951]